MKFKINIQVAKQSGLWTEKRSLSGFMRACKFLVAAFLVIALYPTVKAQTVLVAGDIAFSGYKSNDAVPDQFSFVLLKSIAINTVIRFSDYGWRTNIPPGPQFTDSGILESEIVFTATSALVAGQEITIVGTTVNIVNPASGSGTAVYSVGAVFLVGNLTLASNGDQIFAYQGTFAAPVFIAGIHMNVTSTALGDTNNSNASNWDGVIPAASQQNNNSEKPAALTTGTNANWFTVENDNTRFVCGTGAINSVPAARASLNSGNTTPANWLSNSTNPSGFTLPTGCMYLVGGGCSITLSSAAGTNIQTRCINTAITTITYATTGATGATFSGLPGGVTGSWASDVVTISGSPNTTVGSPFNYTVTLTGGSCTTENATGTITVNPNNTILLTSSAGTNNQTVAAFTPITNITYSTTSATGATFTGLPPGVTGNWVSNVVTISGSPTTNAGSPYNYTVTLTGGCGVITAMGTITVTPAVCSITLTSAAGTNNQTVLISTPITNITYSTVAATGATFSGLPTGVNGTWASNVVTISGTPSVAGVFNYTVTLTGGSCTTENAMGTITVNGLPVTLVAGDIAFSGYISNDVVTDQFSFVLLKNLTPGSVIKFTDYGWRTNISPGPQFINGSSGILESEITFTATSNLVAGQEITIVGTTVNIVNPASGSGTAVYSVGANFLVGNLALASNGDQLFAYQGTFAAPSFIAGIHMNVTSISLGDTNNSNASDWDGVIPAASQQNNNSEKPSTLTTGTNANWFTTEWDNVRFICGSTPINTVPLTRAALNSGNTIPGNWTTNNTSPSGFTLPTGCPYLAPPPPCPITLTSAVGTNVQTVCLNTPIINITYSNPAGQGASNALFSGLPAGVTGSWSANVSTITGSPTTLAGSPFTYTVTLIGGSCAGVTAMGTITVTPSNTVSGPSSTPTLCINTLMTNITHTTTGATGIGAPVNLPAGVVANFASNTITISGTPTASGIFMYSIPLTGGCGNINATGTITVNPLQSANFAYALSGYCKTGTDPLPIIYGNAGGTFTAPVQIVINSGSGLIDVSASTAGGPFTITYTNAGACPGSATFPVTIVNCAPGATMTDVITIDNGTPGVADPNDRIRLTATISNTQAADYESVQMITNNDPRVTLVSGSFKSTPVAVNDLYATTLNTMLTVPVGTGLLANDFDNNIPGLTVTTFPVVSTMGGTIMGNANGSFTYNPANGFTGNDTFPYTITDSDGQSNSGMVKIHVQ